MDLRPSVDGTQARKGFGEGPSGGESTVALGSGYVAHGKIDAEPAGVAVVGGHLTETPGTLVCLQRKEN
jgi:hypothetical protein